MPVRDEATATIESPSLGIADDTFLQTVKRLQRGLSFGVLTRFQKASGFELDSISEVIRLPRRTLARRKAEGKLRADESERLLRLALLFDKAVALCEGDVAAARDWLSRPKKAFSGKTPLEMAETELGGREVENLIGRLEHGVFN